MDPSLRFVRSCHTSVFDRIGCVQILAMKQSRIVVLCGAFGALAVMTVLSGKPIAATICSQLYVSVWISRSVDLGFLQLQLGEHFQLCCHALPRTGPRYYSSLSLGFGFSSEIPSCPQHCMPFLDAFIVALSPAYPDIRLLSAAGKAWA